MSVQILVSAAKVNDAVNGVPKLSVKDSVREKERIMIMAGDTTTQGFHKFLDCGSHSKVCKHKF